MDTALQLKIEVDNKRLSDPHLAQSYLQQSRLFNQLLTEIEPSPMNLLWRLTQLAEIPYAGSHPKVKRWLQQLVAATYTGDGFSLNGSNDYMLACYNGMITRLLIKLNEVDATKIDSGIQWILKYQQVARGRHCTWEGSAIQKYGGCMKQVPCYMGLVKSMVALSDYKQRMGYKTDNHLETMLEQGLEYILNHKVYLKLSNHQPITKDITKITFPFTWKTNVIEILRLLKANHLLSDSRCQSAKGFLLSKRKKDGYWRSQSVYILKNKTWIPFDPIGQPGHWISHEIARLV